MRWYFTYFHLHTRQHPMKQVDWVKAAYTAYFVIGVSFTFLKRPGSLLLVAIKQTKLKSENLTNFSVSYLYR